MDTREAALAELGRVFAMIGLEYPRPTASEGHAEIEHALILRQLGVSVEDFDRLR